MSFGGEALKVKSNENKQTILTLLEQSNSVEQHIYYQKGESPEKIQQYYLGTKGQSVTGGTNTMAPLSKPRIEEIKSTLTFRQPKKPNVLRTIYMPNYEVDAAREQIDAMRAEIDEERIYYEDIMKKMQDEKAVFEEQERAKYNALMNQYQMLQK